MPIGASTRCCLPLDAQHRAAHLRSEFECDQEDSTEILGKIQHAHRFELVEQSNEQIARWARQFGHIAAPGHLAQSVLDFAIGRVQNVQFAPVESQ